MLKLKWLMAAHPRATFGEFAAVGGGSEEEEGWKWARCLRVCLFVWAPTRRERMRASVGLAGQLGGQVGSLGAKHLRFANASDALITINRFLSA